jgi:hypothetical protein
VRSSLKIIRNVSFSMINVGVTFNQSSFFITDLISVISMHMKLRNQDEAFSVMFVLFFFNKELF